MRKPISKTLFLIIFLSGFLLTGYGQTEKAKKLDDLISSFAQAKQFSGVILTSENGTIIYEKAFGMANVEFKIPNQVNTKIGIASITKPMTSVILIRLIEEKKIALDDKLSKYIPDFPNGDKITIEMLSRHRSGIPHRVMPPEQETVSYTSAEMVEKIKLAKLAFEPGMQRLYSSAGYTVLARTLEIASGKSYAQLLNEYVFAPAGMKDSLDFNGEMIIERRAQDYLLDSNGYINAAFKDYSFLVGAGSVFGTAGDIYKFGTGVLDGKYGENVRASLVGQTTISGSGSTNGHRSYFEIEREKKYGYVILSNLACGGFDLVQRGVGEILQGKDVSISKPMNPKIIPNPNKDLNEFLGRYKRSDGSETEIVLKYGFLYSSDIKLFPIKPDCFFDYKFFGEACFIRETDGKIKELKWKGATFDLTWAKQ